VKRVTPISTRKSDHIRINLEEDVRSGLTTGLERYRFIHRALPELDLEEIDLSLNLFGRRLRAPVLISSMTGGNDQAAALNRILACAAQQTGVAMGLGSQRAAIDHPELAFSFQVRREAPDVLLFANLGAVQLNYGYGIAQCQPAVEMVEADALILHFNPLQEALQTEGNTNFSGLLQKVEDICRALPVPVIAKEVGWGFSEQDVRLLAQTGVAAIDVAGSGGTSWSQVEMYRAKDENQARLAAAFVDWGTPTCEAISNVSRVAPGMMVFASGGLRSGVDIAKCLALGATLGGMASPFLKAAARSLDVTVQSINETRREIQVCMFAAGVRDLVQLRQLQLMEIED
jgi:isopentenyl-diphosphate delta-isomerase